MTTDAIATPLANAAVLQSTDRSRTMRPVSIDNWFTNSRLAHDAVSTPATAEATLSKTLSVKSCRTRRYREAPSATRTLSS